MASSSVQRIPSYHTDRSLELFRPVERTDGRVKFVLTALIDSAGVPPARLTGDETRDALCERTARRGMGGARTCQADIEGDFNAREPPSGRGYSKFFAVLTHTHTTPRTTHTR